MTTLNDAAVEAAAREMYRQREGSKFITSHDSQRSDESDRRESDRAYERWDSGRAGYAIYERYRRMARTALTAALPHLRKDWEAERLAALSTRSLIDTIKALGICDESGHVQSCGYDENDACFCSTLPQRLRALLHPQVPK